jgi:signal transduction histidine kinase
MIAPFRRLDRLGRRSILLSVVGAGLTVAVVSQVWLAYRAIGEWRRSTALLVDQRSEEALTLLTVALSRDMKGVHDSVLASFNESALNLDRSFELENLFAQALARFPYPESFFVWRETDRGDSTITFNRVDRPPRWAHAAPQGPYPVASIRDSAVASGLVANARILGQSGQRFRAFDTTLEGEPYQVVVHLLYHTLGERRLYGAIGFTVNLNWVRHEYFQDILKQISAIGNIEGSTSLSITDHTGALVASTKLGATRTDMLHSRKFRLSFLDPDLVLDTDETLVSASPEWTASVSAADDQGLAAASRGSSRTLWLVIAAAVAIIMGVVFTLRALKASSDLADMQSEFVASATHELKTPLAVFQLVAETLAKGRYHSAETIRVYAGLLSDQTHLLERLIDNVLAYGSLGHVAQRYAFQALSLSEILESALERFDARLAATGMEVKVDVSPDLPKVRADRQSLMQVFDNVIDNAIKYSPNGDALTVRATAVNGLVHVEIADRGVGIPEDERGRVFEKFYRGQGAINTPGSGLGLTIARRVINDHGGRIELRSGTPDGTVVDIGLPVAN